jgi:organic radical activating enzyme
MSFVIFILSANNLNKGANTAMNRTANFLASPANRIFFGSNKTIKDFPNIYNKYISSPSQDFSKLSKEDQDALFLGDKIYGGKDRRDEFDKVLKSPTQENIFMYWLKNHKGKVNNKTVNKLTEEEIQQERLKWNERTKSIFRP